jgi:hypothetical protein
LAAAIAWFHGSLAAKKHDLDHVVPTYEHYYTG